MKSSRFALSFLPSFLENRLLIVSFWPIFRRFVLSFCSANTRAVSEEVAAFLIPLFCAWSGTGVEDDLGASRSGASLVVSVGSVFFLRFLGPGSFFKECVRPCSASFCPRAMSLCLSSSFVVRIEMMFSSVYDSLHLPRCQSLCQMYKLE